MSLAPDQASIELLRRKRARESLIGYSQAVEIPGAPVSDEPDEWIFKPIESSVALHHLVIMDALERCIRADYGRLMIFAPPGSAKSTYASVVAPAWAMCAFPGLRVVNTSYSGTPAERSSKRTRQLVSSALSSSCFQNRPTILAGSSGVQEWEMTNGSGYFAAGLMGGITSVRGDVAIVDDPVAGREEADSEAIRSKTRAAYQDDVMTRLKPKASVILIQTRWHMDDLAGSILPESWAGESGKILCRDGQVWEVLNLQAKCTRLDDPLERELGEYIWPEWFDAKHWAQYESTPRTWNALYQGLPTVAEGGQFKRDAFLRYDKPPKNVVWWITGDWAVTKKMETNRPDFTELMAVGIDPDGHIWFDNGTSGQDSIDVSIDNFLSLARAYKAKQGGIEKGVIWNAVGSQLERAMRESGPWVNMETVSTTADKVAMAQSFRGMVNAGKVHVRNSPWGNRLIEQCAVFPHAVHDDMVDGAGILPRIIDDLHASKRDKPEIKKSVIPFSAQMAEAYRLEDEDLEDKVRNFHG